MQSPKKTINQVTGASGNGHQPASSVHHSVRTTTTARHVNKSLAVVNGLLRLVPTAFFAWGAILCITHGVYLGALMLLAAAYYGWRALRFFMQ